MWWGHSHVQPSLGQSYWYKGYVRVFSNIVKNSSKAGRSGCRRKQERRGHSERNYAECLSAAARWQTLNSVTSMMLTCSHWCFPSNGSNFDPAHTVSVDIEWSKGMHDVEALRHGYLPSPIQVSTRVWPNEIVFGTGAPQSTCGSRHPTKNILRV